MKKKIFKILAGSIISILAVSLISMACTTEINAETAENNKEYPVIVEKLAEKLGIDPEKIVEAFKEIQEERIEEKKKCFEEKLDKAVKDGILTEEQKEAILKKREELAEKKEELKDLSRKEREKALKEIKEDLEEWAKDHDIDLKWFFLPKHHVQSGIWIFKGKIFRPRFGW